MRVRLLLLVFTLIGLVATASSSWVHYQLVSHPDLVSVCDVSATVNCTDAYKSAYGSIGGVPVALLGLAYFAVLLLVQLGTIFPRVPHPEHLEGYVFALALPGAVFSGYMAYAAWFVLKVLCLLCLATYVAVAGLFLVSGLSTRFSMPKLSPRVSRDVSALRSHPVAVAIAVLVLAALAGLIGFFPRSAPEATLDAKAPADFEAPEAAEPAVPQASQLEQYLATAPRRMIPVDVKADVIVVKFNDYQCPSCGQVHNLYKPLKQKWDREAPGRVKFVSKDFPLEPECNATIKNGLHQMACEAAAAVRMARRNNKAEPLEDWIFANQATLTLDGIKKAVRDIGGVSDFDAQYPRVLNDVKIDTSLGGFLGVGSTPTFFINGVQMPDLRPAVMDAAIAAELRRIGPR